MFGVNINWSSWPLSAWFYTLHCCSTIGWVCRKQLSSVQRGATKHWNDLSQFHAVQLFCFCHIWLLFSFYCSSQIMTQADPGVIVSYQALLRYEWTSATHCKHKWQENEFQSGGVMAFWMACHCAQPSTTNIWAGLCWIFNACQVCVEMGRTALPDSLWDMLAVGFTGCGSTLSEGSVWTVTCREAIMSQQRSFSLQSKWSQTKIAAKRTQAITSSTFIRVSRLRGSYMDFYGCYHKPFKKACYTLWPCWVWRWRSATDGNLNDTEPSKILTVF